MRPGSEAGERLVDQQPTLLTERLELRPFRPGDAPRVQEIASAREIADTTLSIPHPYPPGAAVGWIATHALAWEAGTGAVFAITERTGAALVGAVGLAISPEHARAELGYWVAVSHWGMGYCTEAARAILAFAFGPLALHRVQARHFVRNPASGRVMQKLGMRHEGVHRDAMRKWGRFEDLAQYAILAGECGGDGRPTPAHAATFE